METMNWPNEKEELANYLASLPEEQANQILDELAEELAKAMALKIIRSHVAMQVGLVMPRIRSQLGDIRKLLRQELKDAGSRTDYRTASGSIERLVPVG